MDIPENIIIDFVEKICKDLELEYETFSKLEDVIVDSKKDFLKDDDNVEDYQLDCEDVEDDVDCVEIIYTKEMSKKCSKCLKMKTYTEFNKDKTKKYGYHTICKDCEKESKRLYKERKLKEIEEANLQEKECFKCNKIQPICEYTLHLYTKDGYTKNCKSCSRLEINR